MTAGHRAAATSSATPATTATAGHGAVAATITTTAVLARRRLPTAAVAAPARPRPGRLRRPGHTRTSPRRTEGERADG